MTKDSFAFEQRATPPCPSCGSTAVRWRNRRFYDLLITWALVPLQALSGGLSTRDRAIPLQTTPWLAVDPGKFNAKEIADVNSIFKTPKYFWRCPSCKSKGSMYQDADFQSKVENAAILNREGDGPRSGAG